MTCNYIVHHFITKLYFNIKSLVYIWNVNIVALPMSYNGFAVKNMHAIVKQDKCMVTFCGISCILFSFSFVRTCARCCTVCTVCVVCNRYCTSEVFYLATTALHFLVRLTPRAHKNGRLEPLAAHSYALLLTPIVFYISPSWMTQCTANLNNSQAIPSL